ncbi:hypothetical protein CJ030_MR4G028709 [Morella rubra]|uniref:Uncharacterized protein n=1 Tax=Morella rubra TaxID=262757 RepID=A0A6A1VTB7_9ROSI|nr:hypothetical protein CJ030_MR4G028709 [Morella rubra]
MRDIVSCFSENAVNVSHPSCSSYPNTACMKPGLTPSVQNSVTCVYKISLSTQKQILITVTWCKNHSSQGLSINFGDDPSTPPFRLNTNSRLFRKKKGSKTVESDNSSIEVFWDLSTAKYGAGPEPVDGFYVLVVVDSEICLILGDMAEEAVSKKFKSTASGAKVSLISRREHCSGNTLYSTKAQFCDTGIAHDILIRCSGESEGLRSPVLSVCIDRPEDLMWMRLVQSDECSGQWHGSMFGQRRSQKDHSLLTKLCWYDL